MTEIDAGVVYKDDLIELDALDAIKVDQAVDNLVALGPVDLGAEVEDDALLVGSSQIQEIVVVREASVRKLRHVELEIRRQSESCKHDLWQDLEPSEG